MPASVPSAPTARVNRPDDAQDHQGIQPNKKRKTQDKPASSSVTIGQSGASGSSGPIKYKPANPIVSRSSTKPALLKFSDGQEYRLFNIISTFETRCNFNMRQLATRARNVEYNSKKNPAACYFKLRNPSLSGVVFMMGKVNVLGGKNLDEQRLSAKKLARLLQKCGYPHVKFVNYKVENMNATVNLGNPIRLQNFASKYVKEVTYEPEITPSLLFRLPGKEAMIQCWSTGKIIICGAKKIQDFQEIYDQFKPIVQQFYF